MARELGAHQPQPHCPRSPTDVEGTRVSTRKEKKMEKKKQKVLDLVRGARKRGAAKEKSGRPTPTVRGGKLSKGYFPQSGKDQVDDGFSWGALVQLLFGEPTARAGPDAAKNW